jgi:hypothetical protein
MPQRLVFILVALAVLAGALLLVDFGQGERAQALGSDRTDEEESSTMAELELPVVEQAETVAGTQREADFVRMEIRGELIDGTVIHGPTVMFGGPNRVASIAVPEDDGATYLYGQDGEMLGVEIVHFDVESEQTLEARGYVQLVDGTILVLPLREPFARLTGLVVRDGQPLPHAEIRLTNGGGDRPIEVDEQGRFELLGALGIKGELRAGHKEFPSARMPVAVTTGSQQDVVFELPGGELEIRVIPEDRSAFRGAVMVVLYRVDAEQNEARLVPLAEMSSDRGIARFQGLPPGEYWVEVSRLTNTRSAPSVARIDYRGGFVVERVRMQVAAELKVQVLRPLGMDPTDERKVVHLWEMRRDGIVVEEWDDAQQVILASDDHPWTTLEFQPGELQIRVGDPEVGFADATVTLWPGLETELKLQLKKPAVQFEVIFPSSNSWGTTIQVVDDEGRWVGEVVLNEAERRLQMRLMRADDPEAVLQEFEQEGRGVEVPRFGVPAPGHYRFYHVDGVKVRSLGSHQITAATRVLTFASSD